MDERLFQKLEGRKGKRAQMSALKQVIAWQVGAAFGLARLMGAGRVRCSSSPVGRPMIRA